MNLSTDCTLIGLNITQWTGKVRFGRDELDPAVVASMPPEALASLGTKKLMDPAKLRVFHTIKARASTLLERYGTKLFGGVVISNDNVAAVDTELLAIKQTWDKELDAFINNFDAALDDWCSQYPQWSQSIRGSIPTAGEVRNRFGFSWTAVKIMPNTDASTSCQMMGSEVMAIGDKTFDDISTLARRAFDGTFKDRDATSKLTAKTFNCVKQLADKIAAVSFTDERVRTLSTCMQTVVKDLDEVIDAKVDLQKVVEPISNLLIALSSAEGIKAKIAALPPAADQNDVSALCNSIMHPAPVQPVQPVMDDVVVDDIRELAAEAEECIAQPKAPVIGADLTKLLDEEDLW